jgi:hypothetical protein
MGIYCKEDKSHNPTQKIPNLETQNTIFKLFSSTIPINLIKQLKFYKVV